MAVRDKLNLILAGPHWTQQKVAERLGVSQSTINRWLKGTEPEGHHRDSLSDLYAEVYGYNPQTGMMRVAGQVIQGGLINFLPEADQEWTEIPPVSGADVVAFQVATDALMPEYERGSVIYYAYRTEPENVVDHRCVVGLADGRLMLRTVRYGFHDGRYTLSSSGAADIHHVEISWAAPVVWVKTPIAYVPF